MGRLECWIFSEKAVQEFLFLKIISCRIFFTPITSGTALPGYCKTTGAYPKDSMDSAIAFMKKKTREEKYHIKIKLWWNSAAGFNKGINN